MATSIKEKLNTATETMWYQQLAYIPTEYKDSRLWMAKSLFWAKMNSQLFQEREKAIKYRKTDVLDLDRQTYINLIDPPTAKDKGGKAEYFSADFKAFPIDVHLDNIADASIRTIPLRLTCTLADPVAKSLEQRDKEKIIAQGMVRDIINDFAKELGIPRISESVDPYKWIQNFTAPDGTPKVDEIGNAIDQIKTKIKDDDGLRLFQSYLYKNGLEVAFEIGIKYYFLDENEWQIKYSDGAIRDLKHFNKYSGMWAIDETTGRGKIRYIDPTTLYTSPFKDKNGDDILYYFFEENVNFAEWERLVGSQMTYEEKKRALELQKRQGWFSGTANFNGDARNNNSNVRLGFFWVLTQEANEFSERYINDDTSIYVRPPLTYEPDKGNDADKTAKVYNVGYSCYYMPLTANSYSNNSPTDWTEQSNYIFKIQKDIDMMRFGENGRYTKSPLVIYKNDKQASWTDIKESFMPKIHTLWHKFQNCIVQDVQGLALDYDLLGGMLNAVDEANTNGEKGGTAIVNEWKMLRQAGMAWLKFRDKNGNMLIQDPAKLFVPIDSGHVTKGEKYLLLAMNLYNLLTQALATGGASEALQPSARTALGGIEIAQEASNKARYFLEEAYIQGIIIPYAQRCAHFIHTICKEKKDYNYDIRFKQFNDVIGRYNGAVIESLEDISFENIGLTVENKDDSANREIILQNVVQKAAINGLDYATLGLVLDTSNWKLQIVELVLNEKKQNEQRQAEAAQQQEYQLQQMQMQLKIADALNQSKAAGKDKNIQTQGAVDAQIEAQSSQLKSENMRLQKDQLLKNKLIESQQKAELNKDLKSHEASLDEQKSLITNS